MKESSTYQAILEEGRVGGRKEGAIAELKKMLRDIGDGAFGPPDAQTAAALVQLNQLTRLEHLLKGVRTATSWQQLLRQPAPGRRSRRRSL